MLTLSATLTAAQKSASLLPYVKVVTKPYSADVHILAWARYYTGAEAAQPSAVTMPADGSLVRARATGGRVYVDRVATPGSGSTYSNWTDLTACHASSPVALCSKTATVWLFYVDAAGTGIKVRTSTDSGATWSAEAAVGTAAGTVTYLAAAAKATTDLVLIYAVGADVYTSTYAAGAWGALTAWSNTAASVTGLSVYYVGDYNVIVTGTEPTTLDYMVWSTLFGDNYSVAIGTWDVLTEVVRAHAGSAVEYHQPSVGFPDVHRLWFLEKYTGTGAYNRPCWSHGVRGSTDYISAIWREPVPFNLSTICGVQMAASATGVWAVIASGVWYAAVDVTATELTTDVLGVEVSHDGGKGQVQITLRNDDGRYNTGGSLAGVLIAGHQVEVSLGCTTSAGNETTSTARCYWIRYWERSRVGGVAVVTIVAGDAWSLLDGLRTRRARTWAAGTRSRYQLLALVFGLVGLELSSTGSLSTAFVTEKPALALSPNESAGNAARRILAQVPEVVYWGWGVGYAKQPASGDASVYAYGTDHVIRSARRREECYPYNRVAVFGTAAYGESVVWAEVDAGGDRLQEIVDAQLDTAAKCTNRAAAVVRDWDMAATPVWIQAPVNCGVEMYDVVTVTESAIELAAAKRRVRGYVIRYRCSGGHPQQWDMDLALGGA